MRLIVTGSDGYIGRGVVRRLLADGHEVVALGLSPCGLAGPGLDERVGDAFAFDFGDGSRYDALVHLAWRNGFSHGDPCHVDDLPAHYRLLGRAVEAGVPRVAAMGTMHEVGYHVGAVDEGTPCRPTTPYGVAKNALRQLSEGLCDGGGARLQWLRGFYLASADGRGGSVFSKIVRAARSGRESFPFTSGRCAYDFLPYGEFCDQVVAAVCQDEVCGTINVCSGRAVPIGEYVEGFIRDNGLPIRLEYGAYPDRPYDSPAIWGDPAKIERILRR